MRNVFTGVVETNNTQKPGAVVAFANPKLTAQQIAGNEELLREMGAVLCLGKAALLPERLYPGVGYGDVISVKVSPPNRNTTDVEWQVSFVVDEVVDYAVR